MKTTVGIKEGEGGDRVKGRNPTHYRRRYAHVCQMT